MCVWWGETWETDKGVCVCVETWETDKGVCVCMYICVCVCVRARARACVCERERERQTDRQTVRELQIQRFNTWITFITAWVLSNLCSNQSSSSNKEGAAHWPVYRRCHTHNPSHPFPHNNKEGRAHWLVYRCHTQHSPLPPPPPQHVDQYTDVTHTYIHTHHSRPPPPPPSTLTNIQTLSHTHTHTTPPPQRERPPWRAHSPVYRRCSSGACPSGTWCTSLHSDAAWTLWSAWSAWTAAASGAATQQNSHWSVSSNDS